jgi:hypothetical protein
MLNFGIGALVVLLYVNPLLIACIWLMRLTEQKLISSLWRSRMAWTSLSLATAAVGIFWVATLSNKYPEPHAIASLRLGFNLSLIAAVSALLAAALAKGRGRVLTAVSALIAPLNWIMWAAFQ